MVDMIAATETLIGLLADGADEAERAVSDVYSVDALPKVIGQNTAYAARHGNTVTLVLSMPESLAMMTQDFDSPTEASEGIDVAMAMYDENHKAMSSMGFPVSPVVNHVTFQRPERTADTPRGWGSTATV